MYKKTDRNTPFSIERKKLLLVEGMDEVYFFDKLLEKIDLQEQVQCVDVGGKDKFKNYFETQILLPADFLDVTNIAFIRDADNCDAINALNSIKNAINSINKKENRLKNIISNCSIQNNVYREEDSKLTCGIFIMPNNKDKGMLEDLCLKYIEKNTPSIYNCINLFMDSIEKVGIDTNRHLSKRKMLAFLATKDKIVYSLGLAAQDFNFNDDCFYQIRDFLLKVFS